MTDNRKRRPSTNLYESRPSQVEAVRWSGFNLDELWRVFGEGKVDVDVDVDVDVHVHSAGGLEILAGKDRAQDWVPVPIGHWVVGQPGDNSDIWPVEDEYFQAKYKPVKKASNRDVININIRSCPTCGISGVYGEFPPTPDAAAAQASYERKMRS